jgi:hypothetical protein
VKLVKVVMIIGGIPRKHVKVGGKLVKVAMIIGQKPQKTCENHRS